MKTKEEIDELYHKYWDDFSSKYDDNLHYYSFVEGYTQCQEDVDWELLVKLSKRYTEEDIRKAIQVGVSAEAGDYPKGWSYKLGITLEDYYINSLNKQD